MIVMLSKSHHTLLHNPISYTLYYVLVSKVKMIMYHWNQYANDKKSETLSLTMQNDTLDNITLMQDSKESNLVLFNYIETLSLCDKKEDNNNYYVSSSIYVNMHLLCTKRKFVCHVILCHFRNTYIRSLCLQCLETLCCALSFWFLQTISPKKKLVKLNHNEND